MSNGWFKNWSDMEIWWCHGLFSEMTGLQTCLGPKLQLVALFVKWHIHKNSCLHIYPGLLDESCNPITFRYKVYVVR